MDILDALKKRKSIRAFKPDPVPKEILREILEIAACAPSAMNTQPWEFLVLAGELLEKIGRANAEALKAGTFPSPEHQVVGWSNDSIFRTRQIDLAKKLFKIMDIKREDKEKRHLWMERGFRHFDAPVSIVLLTDSSLAESSPLLDLGGVMQSICLAALSFGLGTCIEDQSVLYPQNLRENCNIGDDKKIIIGIAIGYPDLEFPANAVESGRENIDDITSWVGFD